jgi:hypothetical protein
VNFFGPEVASLDSTGWLDFRLQLQPPDVDATATTKMTDRINTPRSTFMVFLAETHVDRNGAALYLQFSQTAADATNNEPKVGRLSMSKSIGGIANADD